MVQNLFVSGFLGGKIVVSIVGKASMALYNLVGVHV